MPDTPVPYVAAVSRSPRHTFSKSNEASVRLVAGLGVEGDAHAGVTVKHRSRVARDASQPNLRQVHLVHAELHDELRTAGFSVNAGELGENVTTRGVDLLGLPTGTRLMLGDRAVVEIAGLRNPCVQLNDVHLGLMNAVLGRDAQGAVVRKAGVMGVVIAGGEVRPGDAIRVDLPPSPHRGLVPGVTDDAVTVACARNEAQTGSGTEASRVVGCSMSDQKTATADLVPVLSRGKHRNPRRGACFMEYASYLAGERWSDHPACTHALLAALARHVNDYTTDAARPRLAELVPSVIGLTSDNVRVDVLIALRGARTALPVVAAERQRVLAAAVLAAERMLAELDGRPADSITELSRRSLDQVPQAEQWARQFTRGIRTSAKAFRRHAGPTTVHCAVEGIAQACVADPDSLLRELLSSTIEDCREMIGPHAPTPAPVQTARWSNARRLARVR